MTGSAPQRWTLHLLPEAILGESDGGRVASFPGLGDLADDGKRFDALDVA